MMKLVGTKMIIVKIILNYNNLQKVIIKLKIN